MLRVLCRTSNYCVMISREVGLNSAFQDHTCAVTSKRSLLCFGKNEYGQVVFLDALQFCSKFPSFAFTYCRLQIGDGSKTNRATPRAVVGLSSGVVSVAAGRVRYFEVEVDV